MCVEPQIGQAEYTELHRIKTQRGGLVNGLWDLVAFIATKISIHFKPYYKSFA